MFSARTGYIRLISQRSRKGTPAARAVRGPGGNRTVAWSMAAACLPRGLACRPRRIRSATNVRSYSVDQQHLVGIIAIRPIRLGDQDWVRSVSAAGSRSRPSLGRRRLARCNRHRGRRTARPTPSHARQLRHGTGQTGDRMVCPRAWRGCRHPRVHG
jgi:hypothetical protein